MEILKNYIDGIWQESVTGRTREVICPSDGTVIAVVTESDQEDAKQGRKESILYRQDMERYDRGRKSSDS